MNRPLVSLICLLMITDLFVPAYAQKKEKVQSLFDGRRVLIQLKTKDLSETAKIIREIETNEGHVVHVFPPDILHGYVTAKTETTLTKSGKIKMITDKEVKITPAKHSTNENLAFETWNGQFVKLFATRGENDKGDKDHGTTKAPDLENLNNTFVLRGQKNFYLTSEYMIGTTAVGVMFVESDGSVDKKTESWTLEDKIDVMRQIYKGLDWWAENGGYTASLTFIYDIIHIDTKYEPINRTKNESVLWVNDCMNALGYTDGEDYTLNRQYANDLREKYSADWSFIMYVVPSNNDDDGYFAEQSGIAWAYLGGPYMVFSNKCNGWGYNQVWKVVAHETAHIFNALDEYKGASSCNDKSGRLNIVNGNHEDGGITRDPCIMKATDLHVCDFTRGQIGWKDDDGDGFFDADYLNISKRFNADQIKKETISGVSGSRASAVTRFNEEKNILLYEDFSTRNGWYEDQYNFLKDGSYHMYDPQYGTTAWLERPFSDFSASVKTRWRDGSSVSGYGLMFRIFGPNDSYIFFINGDGQYCVGMYYLGNWNYLKEWDRSDAINLNGENTLRADCIGNRMRLFINGKPVADISDTTFTKGAVGFVVMPEVHVDFDDLLITNPE